LSYLFNSLQNGFAIYQDANSEKQISRKERTVNMCRAGLVLGLVVLLALEVGCNIPSGGQEAAPPYPASQPSPIQQEIPGPSEETVPAGAYEIGNPSLIDIWVDPVSGDDTRSGTSAEQALRTINAAWERIPAGVPLAGKGYRIQLMPGEYPDSDFPVYWESRYGSRQAPIILQSAYEPGSAILEGFVNIFDCRYLYWMNLAITTQGDAFHCEQCDHLLLRGVRIDGGDQHNAHEAVKINQSQYVYIEDSDIANAYENAVDYVAVQYGHITGSRLHGGDDWCIYLKGGSAYFHIEANEIFDCGTGGFSAGQGSGLEYLVSPWLHYEAYEVKFVNNLVHDTQGAGMGVNGGYNILLAYNTLFRVGSNSHLIEVVFGSRSCDEDSSQCALNLSSGGWGTFLLGASGEPIPDSNIYIYNNILYNPPGFQSQWQQFMIMGPRMPSAGSNIPSPAVTDANLQVRGNLIWNGGADMPLGIEDSSQGCQDSNPTCNATQLLRDNAINTLEPQFVDLAAGDFHPLPGGNIFRAITYEIPDFSWQDAPISPPVPPGNLDNRILLDHDGQPRYLPGLPGAYAVPAE
jgi:hypothetical protein